MIATGFHSRTKRLRHAGWIAVWIGAGLILLGPFARLVVHLGGGWFVIPGVNGRSIEMFADEAGLPVSKPRDTIRVGVAIEDAFELQAKSGNWALASDLQPPFTPANLPFIAQTRHIVTIHHNGLGGEVQNWTRFPPEQERLILRQNGDRFASRLRDRFPHQTESNERLRAVLRSGIPLVTTNRYYWSNIPIRLSLVIPSAWRYTLGFLALAAGVVVLKRVRPVEVHQCRNCGYDLRGTAPGRPCPECGMVIASQPPPENQEKTPHHAGLR